MTDVTPEQIAVDASAPGKFSLIDRLRNRNYPSEDVSIYLAEDAAYSIQALHEQAADVRIYGSEEQKAKATAKLDEIYAKIEALKEEVRESEVIISIRAISSERYDELIAEAKKRFPVKYEKVMNPLTGKATMEEIASDDRDLEFDNLFMSEVIVKATFNGDVDDEITPEWWVEFKKLAPLDALRVVVQKAFKMRMVTEWMDEVQNEDFSPRL